MAGPGGVRSADHWRLRAIASNRPSRCSEATRTSRSRAAIHVAGDRTAAARAGQPPPTLTTASGSVEHHCPAPPVRAARSGAGPLRSGARPPGRAGRITIEHWPPRLEEEQKSRHRVGASGRRVDGRGPAPPSHQPSRTPCDDRLAAQLERQHRPAACGAAGRQEADSATRGCRALARGRSRRSAAVASPRASATPARRRTRRGPTAAWLCRAPDCRARARDVRRRCRTPADECAQDICASRAHASALPQADHGESDRRSGEGASR